jgi:hypothetical protein
VRVTGEKSLALASKARQAIAERARGRVPVAAPHWAVQVSGFAVLAILAWVLQYWWAPTWLVGSRAGLQTLLQALPAALIALLALAFGAVFVIVQQLSGSLGGHAGLALVKDSRVVALVVTTVLAAAVSLSLGGQVPDEAPPGRSSGISEMLTSGVATLTLAALALVLLYAWTIPRVLTDYTVPKRLIKRVEASLVRRIERERVGTDIELRVLGDAHTEAVRRADAPASEAALDALLAVLRAVLRGDYDVWAAIVEQSASELAEASDRMLAAGPSGPERRRLLEILRLAAKDCIAAPPGTVSALAATHLIRAIARFGAVAPGPGAPRTPERLSAAAVLGNLVVDAEQARRAQLADEALAGWAIVASRTLADGSDGRIAARLRGNLKASGPWSAAELVLRRDAAGWGEPVVSEALSALGDAKRKLRVS